MTITATASDARRVRWADLVRAEWIKLASIPSLVIGVVCLAALLLGLPVLAGLTLDYSGPVDPDLPQTLYMIAGLPTSLAIAVSGVLGALVMSAEYSTRTIQTTLLAAPRRLGVLAAKVVLLFGVTTATSLVAIFAGWAMSHPLFARYGLQADIGEPGVLAALIGAAVSIGLCAACGVGVGAALRSATGSSIVMIALTFGSLLIVMLLPGGLLQNAAGIFALGMAADRMTRIGSEGAFLDVALGQASAPASWIIVAGWAIVAVVVGGILLKRRDA